MKEKEARVDYREHQLVLYVEKKDGSYGPLRTGSYITKNYIDDYWYKRRNLEKEYLDRVMRGEISPIAYYMVLEELTPSELAARVKLPTRKVKRHLAPGISARRPSRSCSGTATCSACRSRACCTRWLSGKKSSIIHEAKTDNPYFSILKIEAGKK